MERDRHSWGGQHQVTLQDVAKLAGVSQSAASVVLNGARSGTRVSAEKRRSVLEAAANMGYRPNAVARSLITGRTHRIGVYTGQFSLNAGNFFFADLLGGVLTGATSMGVNTMIHTSGRGEHQLLDLVSNRSVDGLIVHATEKDPILPLLGELRIPAVAVVDRIDGLPSVVTDDAAGGTVLAQHLAALGHRNVLVKSTRGGQRSAFARIEAFKAAADQLGMRTTSGSASSTDEDGMDQTDIQIVTSGKDRATAIFGWSDFVSRQICEKLLSIGVLIPGTVAVVGFDGFDGLSSPRFQITTIRAHWAKVAEEAAYVLNALILGKDVPAVTTIPIDFIRGNTT